MALPQGAPEPPEEAAARLRAAENIDESLTVEAGAGTGKTTLLVARIVNLVRRAKVDRAARPVRLHEIVAITFTEKAAGELKARLRSVLEQTLATGQFQNQPISERQRTLLSQALEDLDRAVVATIHSFCANMIRERPVEADIDPGRSTADAMTQALLFDEAWQRWREQAYEDATDTALAAAIKLGVHSDRGGPDDRSVSIRDVAETLVNNRDLLEFLPQPIDEPAAWAESKVRIDQCVESIRECLNHTKPPGVPKDKPSGLAWAFLSRWTDIRHAALDDARVAFVKMENIAAQLGGDPRRWQDPKQLERLRELLAELRDRLLSDALAALTHNVMVRLAHRLRDFVASYDQLKKDRGLLDFQDLLLIARDMLRDKAEARKYFRERCRFLLIDEFQDTDPLQAEVAMLLSQVVGSETTNRHGDGSTIDSADVMTDCAAPIEPGRLFLVGDPKQSIYRFRRADIEVFDQCKQWIGRSQQLRIRQNFRSGTNLIEWVNRVFSKLIEPSPDGHYQPQYAPLLPGPKAANVPGEVVLLIPPELQKDCKGAIDDIRYREGCCMALFIKQAIDQEWPCSERPNGLRLGDVAILLPQTTGLEQYEEAFRACGLQYHVTGGKNFYQRVEIKSLINVVTALDNPEDGIAIVAALRSPFFGCSDEDLLRHALAGGAFNYLRPKVTASEPLASIFQLLSRLHHDRYRRPIASLLQDFFDATKGLEAFLSKPNGESRVANLLRIVDSARLLERTDVLTFRGFGRWLRERQVGREEESESPQAEPGDDAVQVLTVHKSKGLEFAMTIVADLQSGDARADERFIFDRVTRQMQLRCGRLRTAGWRDAQDWDLRRAEAERCRLFYVAATRARDYLVLPVFWRKLPDRGEQPRSAGFHKYLEQIDGLLPQEDDPPWGHRSSGTLVFDTRKLPPWPEPLHAPRISFDRWASDPAVERFLVDRADWLRQYESVVNGARTTSPMVYASELVSSGGSATQVISPEVGGRQFGTLVHRLLELHLTGRIPAAESSRIAQGLALTLGLSASAADSAAKLAVRALDAPTVRRLRAATRVFLEVPFSFPDGERIIEGRMDVLAEEPEGLLLVDFKTDHVQPGYEHEIAARYTTQIQAYAAAVRAATGQSVRAAQLVFLRTLACVEVPMNTVSTSTRGGLL